MGGWIMTQATIFLEAVDQTTILADSAKQFLKILADEDDWGTVMQVLEAQLEKKYNQEIDHLYSLIPGRQSVRYTVVK